MQVAPNGFNNPSSEKPIIKKSDKLKAWFWDIISSGLPTDYDLEALRKILLINLVLFIGSFVLIVFGIIEFIVEDYFLSGVNSIILFLLLTLFLYLRKTKDYFSVSLIGTIAAGLFYFFLIAYGGAGNTAHVWSFTYPLIAIFLLGSVQGSVFSLLLLAMACAVFVLDTKITFLATYDPYLKMRFIPAYITIYLLALITEKTRKIIRLRLESAKYELEKTVEKLEKINIALYEKDKQYSQIFESIQDVYYHTKPSGEILIMSPSIRDVIGYDADELIGKSVLELYDDPVERDRLVKQMMISGQVTNYELTLKAKNGRKIISSITGRVLYDKTGQPDGYAGVMRDVTEQRRNAEALEKSEALYRLLADNVTDNLWIFDLDAMRFSYVSPSVMGILGFTAEEATGFQLQDILTPSSLEAAMKTLTDELLESRLRFDINRSRTLEIEQVRKDGTTIWTEVSMRFIYDTGNQPVSILGVTRDISERKRLQTQLQKSQKMESLGLLAGGVAHDLNNVLSGIVSYPELILMSLPDDSKLKKPLQTMMESGLRATAIVQDLLTMARGVAKTTEPLNLNDLITEYLNSPEFDMIKQYHPAVTLKTNLDPCLPNIGGSPVHINKVLMNMVSNAAEAIQGNGNITLSTRNRYVEEPFMGYNEISIGEYVILSISDNGPGISSNDLERIFEPFYTKKKLGRSGTGLGLSVVWNVMQDHKGYIDVATDENGTVFELYFPVTHETLLQKDLPLSINDYMGNGEMVLVVDDVESQREISCKILDILGYKSMAVSSGEEAVECLKNNNVDLVLLDMIMDPGINGYETYRRMLKIRPGQKAVIVSGFSETDDVRKTQALGVDKYIKKPLSIEKIGIAIKEELSKSRL